MTQALGDDDVKAIKNFVHNGGTVIADVRPGCMTIMASLSRPAC